jgi:RNA polymerase sigma factor (sigma-70 family)
VAATKPGRATPTDDRARRISRGVDAVTRSVAPARSGETAGWQPPSWDDIVRTHAARVYRLAYRLSGNREDAEDLTQETFVRVFTSLADYVPGTFEGWLHRITTNLFLDSVRRRQRVRFQPLPERLDDRVGTDRTGPDHMYSVRHLDPDIQDALAALPPDFRVAVVLRDLEDLSYPEIATTLGVKISTVRTRIHRGRSLLRESLAHRAPYRGNEEPGATVTG